MIDPIGTYRERLDLLHQRLIYEYHDNLPDDLRVPKEILKGYNLHERRLVVNDNDRDLYPINLDLPEPPPYHLIDGFGLPREKQYFRRPTLPRDLSNLLSSKGRNASISDIWEELDLKRIQYKSVIYWIHEQWNYRLNGYWFFNNGIPTYLDGWNWMYLSWWKLDQGYPEYRYRDRIFFQFARYCYTTTEAPFFARVYNNEEEEYDYFQNKDYAEKFIANNGLLCRPETGMFIVDMGLRTVLGFNYPKHRREGATYKASMILYEIISRLESAQGGIQSMDETSAKNDVYKDKVLTPFKSLPFFFKPNYLSATTDQLEFDIAMSGSKNGGAAQINTGLESKITYRSSGERQYDGTKLYGYVRDEGGKAGAKPVNLILQHNVVMKTLAQGNKIHGLEIIPSTVSDTSGDAGRMFMQLNMMSKWEERTPADGRTKSGLLSLFTTALYNYDGFTDMYGNPIVKKPTPEQRKFIKTRVGSEKYLEEQLAKHADDPISYYETMREFPTRFRHCFLSAGKESGFNLKVLSDRMAELDMSDDRPRRGNFKWVDKFGGDVRFDDDPDGKFYISYVPPTANKSLMIDGKRTPGNTDMFVSSADPFKFENVKGGKKSNGAGCVKLKHDPIIDPSEKNTANWKTNRTVCTYTNRVDYKDEYKEDMLMMCIWWGTKNFPENNENAIYEYFKLHGFEKYLQYIIVDGVPEPNPGFTSTLEMKQRLFSLIMDYVTRHGMAEKHREVLQEIYDIRGLDDMTNFDLFTAFGGCELAVYFENKTKHLSDNYDNPEDDPIAQLYLGTR